MYYAMQTRGFIYQSFDDVNGSQCALLMQQSMLASPLFMISTNSSRTQHMFIKLPCRILAVFNIRTVTVRFELFGETESEKVNLSICAHCCETNSQIYTYIDYESYKPFFKEAHSLLPNHRKYPGFEPITSTIF